MAGEETTGSKWFWWVMGIVAAVITAAIITSLHLSGASPTSGGTTGGGTTPQAQVLSTTTQEQTTTTDYSGTYNGHAYNAGLVGDLQLQVNEPDPTSGDTTGHVLWSGALSGDGPLRGAFNANNATFEGEVSSLEGPWGVEMSCTFSSSGNVTCNYTLQPIAPNNYGPQQGSLTANKS
jgi:hypothetical protein